MEGEQIALVMDCVSIILLSISYLSYGLIG